MADTGKLSPNEVLILKALKLSSDDHWETAQVAEAVVKRINWHKLSPEQMLKAIELSGGDWRVAQAVAGTGKLSSKQMLRAIELSGGNWEVVEAVLKRIDWGKLSREQMLRAIKISRGYFGVVEAVANRIDWDKLSREQMSKAIKLSGNNPYIAQLVVKKLA